MRNVLMDSNVEEDIGYAYQNTIFDVDIDFNLDDCKVEPFDTQLVVDLFQAWNFTSLISKIPQAEKMMTQKQNSLFDNKVVTPAFRPESSGVPARPTGGKAGATKIKPGYHLNPPKGGSYKEQNKFDN